MNQPHSALGAAEDDEEIDPQEQEKKEIEQAEERVAISANVVHEAIRREGRDELRRPTSALERLTKLTTEAPRHREGGAKNLSEALLTSPG